MFGDILIGLVGYLAAIVCAVAGFYALFRDNGKSTDVPAGLIMIALSLIFAFVTKTMVGW